MVTTMPQCAGAKMLVSNTTGDRALLNLPPGLVSSSTLVATLRQTTREQDARSDSVHFPMSDNVPRRVRAKRLDFPNSLKCHGREYGEVRTKPHMSGEGGMSFVSIRCDTEEQAEGWRRAWTLGPVSSEITFAPVPSSQTNVKPQARELRKRGEDGEWVAC
jgi:hypothetical protein